MAVQIDLNARGNAQQELIQLRETMNSLNKTIAQQRNALIGASDANRKSIREHIAANTALKATIRTEQESLRTKEARLRLLEREAREQDRATQSVTDTLHAFGALNSITNQYVQSLERMIRGWVSAITQIEKYTSILSVVSGDSAIAAIQTLQLLRITRDLVGIDTGTLIQFSARYQAIGLSAQQAENIIVAVTKRMEEQGKAAHVTRRVLEQVSDAINANVVDMRDWRPILREYPTLFSDLTTALGISIRSIDDLRVVSEQFGGIRGLLVEASEGIRELAQGAEVDTLNYQFNQLNDNLLLVRAELGEQFRPLLLSVLKTANSMAKAFSEMRDSLKTFIATLVIATAAFARFISIGAQISTQVAVVLLLRQSLQQLTNTASGATLQTRGLAKGVGTATAAITGALVGVAALSAAYTYLTRHIRATREEFEQFESFQRNTRRLITQGETAIQSRIEELLAFRQELEKTQAELQKAANRRRTAGAGILGPEDIEQYGDVEQRLRQINEQIQALTVSEQRLQTIFEGGSAGRQALRQELDDARNVVIEFRKANQENSAAGKIALRDFLALKEAYLAYGKAVGDAVNRNLELEKSIISLDYAIRSATTQLRSATLGNTDAAYEDTIGLLESEYNKKKEFSELTIKDEDELNVTLHKLHQEYLFEKSRLDEIYRDRVIAISNDITRVSRESVRRQREAEQQAFNTFLSNYKASLDRLNTPSLLRQFHMIVEALTDQGNSFEDARKKAGAYVSLLIREQSRISAALNRGETDILRILRGIQAGLSQYQTVAEQFERTILDASQEVVQLETAYTQTFESIIENSQRATTVMESFTQSVQEASRAVFERDNLFQSPRNQFVPRTTPTTPLDPNDLTGEFGRRLEAEIAAEQQLRRLRRRQANNVVSSATRVADTIINLDKRTLEERKKIFQRIVLDFALNSVKIVARAHLEAYLLKRIDDDVLRHKVANLGKYEAAQRGATLAGAGADFGIGGLGNLASGLGPLAIVPLLFGREFGNLTSGIGELLSKLRITKLFHSAMNDQYAYRAGYSAAASVDPQGNATSRRNAEDFTDFFSGGFLERLQEASGGGEQVIEVHIHNVVSDKVIESTINRGNYLVKKGVAQRRG